MTDGWIRLHRQLLEHPLWTRQPFTWGQAWVDLLLKATYRDSSVIRGYKEIPVLRGQVFTSQLELAKRWQWDRKTVRRFIAVLKLCRMVDSETSNATDTGYTKLTIRNFDKYQNLPEPVWDTPRDTGRDSQWDSASPLASPVLPHFQEGKEGKKVKNTPLTPTASASLIRLYSDLFHAKHGQKPHITRGKDAKLLLDLATEHGTPTVADCLRRYFSTSDDFVLKNAHSLGIFALRFNALLVNANGTPRPGSNAAWEGVQSGEVQL